jgi:hypothetical protein
MIIKFVENALDMKFINRYYSDKNIDLNEKKERKQMKDVIIDIETLSTLPNAIILTIGAIKFNRFEKLKEFDDYETLYIRIDIKSCQNVGLKSDISTVKWWKEQNKDIRYEAINHPDRKSIQEALIELSNFISNSHFIWSQGSFDSVILENAYRACKIDIPWKFWNIRDSRTLFDIMNIDLKMIEYKKESVHNALIDCYRQLIATSNAFQKLKI